MSSLKTINLDGTTYDIGSVIPSENVSETTNSTEVDLVKWLEWTNEWVNASGNIVSNSNYALSEAIESTSAMEFVITTDTNNQQYGLYCWDSDGNYLGLVGSGYTVANTPISLYPLSDTATVRINGSKYPMTYPDNISIVVELDVTTYDWTNTMLSRMNQLTVREDIYEKIDEIQNFQWFYTRWDGKSLVTDGNSLVASVAWGDYVASFLGMTHTNAGGSGSMIVPATWTMQDIIDNVEDNYPESVDLVLLQGDTNGSMDGDVSDQMDDATDPKTTWMARMNYHIRCILAKYPNVNIVLMPDSVRYDGAVKQYTLAKNRASYTAMKELAEYNRLLFWDVDSATPFNPLHDDNYYSRMVGVGDTQDYVHPHTAYTIAKGRAVVQFMTTLIFNPDAPNTALSNWTAYI